MASATPTNSATLSGSHLWEWGRGGSEDQDDEGGEDGEAGGDDDEEPPMLPQGKDCVIFLIDCTRAMHEPFEESTFVKTCLKAARNTLLDKIVSSDKDLVGIIFYGTMKKQNPGDFNNVFVLQDLSMPGAKRIKDLEEIDEKDFNLEYGTGDIFSLSDALWTCSTLFSNVREKTASKRVMIFTNNDSPHEDNGPMRQAAITKAGDLRDVGIDVDLVHLCAPGQLFSVNKFFDQVISVDETRDYTASSSGLDSLMKVVRSKAHKKRALMRIPFTIAPGMEIGVSVFSLVAEAKKGAYTWLEKSTFKETVTKTRYHCKSTGQLLLPANIKPYMPYGGEKVVFEKEEVAKIKKFDNPGLVLLGFKPRECLKRHYNVRNSLFLYPDESVITGSTPVFTSLLESLITKDKIAVCRLIPRIASEPRFVALVPQREVYDENKSQVAATGFHVVHFPFADDMRKLSYERDLPRASEEQIALMSKVAKELTSKKFSSDSFENPSLQKHYRSLEALALEQSTPSDLTDHTEPDLSIMLPRVGALTQAAREALFPADYSADGVAPKRKAPAAKAPAKHARVADGDDDAGPPALTLAEVKTQWQNGKLEKLTVPVLKEVCKLAKLKPKARKGELVEQLDAYFSQN